MSENEQQPENQAAAQANNDQANAQEPQFVLQRIYAKDMSFESPRTPLAFQEEWKPKVKMDINTGVTKLQEDIFEVILTLTITVTSNDQNAYLVELQQAGIFLIRGMEPGALERTLGAYCPNVLFPYARESIDALVTKGNFPPLHLAPINFDAVFSEAIKRKQAQDAEKADGEVAH